MWPLRVHILHAFSFAPERNRWHASPGAISTIKGAQYVKFRNVLKFVPEVLIFRHAEAAPVRILCLREARGFVDLFGMIRVK